MRRAAPPLSAPVYAHILDICWTRLAASILSACFYWRSFGDSNPCFRRERAKGAYASLPIKFCVALRLSGFGPRPCGTRFGREGSGAPSRSRSLASACCRSRRSLNRSGGASASARARAISKVSIAAAGDGAVPPTRTARLIAREVAEEAEAFENDAFAALATAVAKRKSRPASPRPALASTSLAGYVRRPCPSATCSPCGAYA